MTDLLSTQCTAEKAATTYIKEIINGNSVIMLADEEREALDMALENTYEQGK